MKQLRALNIEDSARDHELFRRHMATNGVNLVTERVETVTDLDRALKECAWDVIICDYSMPQLSAPKALEIVRQLGFDTPFIIISGTVGEEEAVRALKAGANDYLMKDNLARLIPAIEREIQDAENRRARRAAEEARKSLDLELHQERERLRNIIATVPGIVWEGWGEGDAVPHTAGFVSDYAEKLLGYDLEKWRSTPDFWLSIIHPDDSARISKLFHDNYAEGNNWRMEFRWIARDGSIVWVESQAIVIRNESGRPAGLRGLSLDITERKNAELAVRESESRFRSLFQAVPQPVWVYDLETLRFLKVNDAAIRQYGYTNDEFLSMSVKDIRPESEVDLFLDHLDEQATNSGYRGIWKHRKRDGTLIDVEIYAHDAQLDGRPCRLIAANDLTRRRLAEEQLIRSEERYRDLVENAHDIIYSHDLLGNYTSINKAGERITGYSREEALKMNITDTVAPEFVEVAREMIKAKLRGEESTAYELEILAKHGERICVEVNTKLIEQDGRPIGVQGIARDITARKHLEEQLRQAQKLESVGRLAGGIAHDFNNMLTAINGYSDLTLRQLPEDHKLRRNIQEIKKAGERSAQLTNQLLAFSRRQLLQLEIVNLNEVLTDTTQILRRVIGEDVELITDLDPHIDTVKFDPGQMTQIVLNLAVNARDAMPGGGKLTIATRNVFMTAEQAKAFSGLVSGAYVQLIVSDTGTGITEADLEHIFEPFFTTKEVGKGTGLGLSTVYGIVKQSGGGIRVSTEGGKGTSFEIFLPRAIEQTAQPADTVEDGDNRFPFGAETILLVEDEDVVRSLLREALEACGYEVIVASDGVAAMEICSNTTRSIDLLVTDVVMPQMGGRELAEKLQVLMPDMPVLLVSGYTDDVFVRESVFDPRVSFIQKPFSLENLSKKVRTMLDGKKGAGK